MACTITTLPPEILIHIFSQLPTKDRQTIATRVCKLFNQTISDTVFEKDREALHRIQRTFPQRLIEAVGLERLINMPILDADPENPGMYPKTQDNPFYQIHEPVRGKDKPFLFFSCQDAGKYVSFVLLFPNKKAKNIWMLQWSNHPLFISKTTDQDYMHIGRIFAGTSPGIWDFYCKKYHSSNNEILSQKLIVNKFTHSP